MNILKTAERIYCQGVGISHFQLLTLKAQSAEPDKRIREIEKIIKEEFEKG